MLQCPLNNERGAVLLLYNDNMAAMVLGCLCKNTNLISNPAYPISKEDFKCNRFHQIVFVGVCRTNL